MPVTVTTEPASRQLTTVERVRGELPDLDEAKALDLIDEATAIIEHECSRPQGFGVCEVSERLGGDGDVIMQLELTPLVSVVAILDGTQAVTDFEIIDTAAAQLYREAGWLWSVGSFSSILGQAVPGQARFNFTARYAAGYRLPGDDPEFELVDTTTVEAPELPEDLERACVELVRALSEAPVATGVASERIGDYAVTYRDNDVANVLPPRVERLIAPYRKVW